MLNEHRWSLRREPCSPETSANLRVQRASTSIRDGKAEPMLAFARRQAVLTVAQHAAMIPPLHEPTHTGKALC